MQTTRFFTLFISAFVFLAIIGCSPSKKTTATPSRTPPSSSGNVSKKRLEMADYARKFIGTPYKYAGTNPKTGFDCSGFTSFVLKGFGYPITPASKGQAVLGREVPISKVQPGDLVFFAENGRDVSHVAMVSRRDGKNVYCIHSTTSRGVIEENITVSKYWQERLLYARDVISN
jgi:cell wall-associated NlpC family hydrolase